MRKNSALARASQSAGRSNYSAWPVETIYATLSRKSIERRIIQKASEQCSSGLIRQTPSAESGICGKVFHKSGEALIPQTVSAELLISIYATASRAHLDITTIGKVFGEHTRPRVWSATPASLTSGSGFSEDAEPRTRGRVRSPKSKRTRDLSDLANRVVVVSRCAPVSRKSEIDPAPWI